MWKYSSFQYLDRTQIEEKTFSKKQNICDTYTILTRTSNTTKHTHSTDCCHISMDHTTAVHNCTIIRTCCTYKSDSTVSQTGSSSCCNTCSPPHLFQETASKNKFEAEIGTLKTLGFGIMHNCSCCCLILKS